ncbi:ABC transporter CbaT [Streptococcus pseudoporcinus]|uniref:ABC transporter CbaT n=1 Tax=Streptococcus pseudoporcinus TaxID=361101 RepID=A0A4U9Z641_9STRE|nr:ABC transporter CbaT [Streptococcus pseudoporcinus]
MRAVKIAEIKDDIESMPLKYQTELSSDSTGISGGQQQRIALARAILASHQVLILDEATSNFDVLTEKKIVDNLMELDITIIFIAHRMTIPERTNYTVVLDKGKLIEKGSHEELMSKDAFYAHLVNG